MQVTGREFLESFFGAMNDRDSDGMVALLHPDFVEDYPQSGERIRGAANLRAIIENYPGGLGKAVEPPRFHGRDDDWLITPAFTVVRVTESGDTGTGIVKVKYPDGSEWWMVALFELRDHLLYRQTILFAPPFDPPEWRARWVEIT
jgi:ketosteroid isomerase-like protein